jgi:serpin B
MKYFRQINAVLAFVAIACSDPAAPPVQPITALPRSLSAGETKIIAASNDFAFDLFRTGNRAQHNANVFISPLSASMALGMTSNGAAGTTYDEMRTGLRLNTASREEVNAGYKSLIELLTGLDRTTTFQIANSIWYQENYPFHASFLDESRSYFNARVEALDFASPSAVNTINSWVSEQTKERIPRILEVIRPDEVMFLINAIYFKGTWQKQFDKGRTQPAPFHAADGTIGSVEMMWRAAGVDHVATSEYSAVDLPYGNTAFTMTVVMPYDTDIDTFAESFDQSKWNALVGGLETSNLEVYLPKFRVEWERLLNDDLQELGMRLPFFAGHADFTRMSPNGRDLFITRVLQKTFVEVDEAGTEAAAATLVGIGEVSLPPSFRADRPFLIVIRERFSGSILFIGKIAKLPA